MADLWQLIESEIPDGRRQLQESYTNLEKVADYCEGNYLQASDKRHALEETKNYTTQSLASVAYQINTLATNFLQLLDQQQQQLAVMESSVNHLSQTVMIHKEKVARREIGVLTTNKSTTRPQGVKNGIMFPEQPERPVKYIRKAIDYNYLDDCGHGVKSAQPKSKRPSSSSNRSSTSSSVSSAPTTKPPTPPQAQISTGTIGRSQGGHYRQTGQVMVQKVATPQVPSHYAPNYPMNQPSHQVRPNRESSGYRDPGYRRIPQSMNTPPPAPPVGVTHPMSQSHIIPPPPSMAIPQSPQMQMPTQNIQHGQGSVSPPPPPPPLPQTSVDAYIQGAPDPPPPPPIMMYGNTGNISPPLPPPPPEQVPAQDAFDEIPPPPPNFVDQADQYGTEETVDAEGWEPKEYLEKVIAIYDYVKDKEDELTFSENQVIYVIKKNDDGWWEGVMDGVTGLFPGNYVEPCM